MHVTDADYDAARAVLKASDPSKLAQDRLDLSTSMASAVSALKRHQETSEDDRASFEQAATDELSRLTARGNSEIAVLTEALRVIQVEQKAFLAADKSVLDAARTANNVELTTEHTAMVAARNTQEVTDMASRSFDKLVGIQSVWGPVQTSPLSYLIKLVVGQLINIKKITVTGKWGQDAKRKTMNAKIEAVIVCVSVGLYVEFEIDDILSFFTSLWMRIGEVIDDVAGTLQHILEVGAKAIEELIEDAAAGVEIVLQEGKRFLEVVDKALDDVAEEVEKFVEEVGHTVEKVAEAAEEAGKDVIETVGEVIEKIEEIGKDVIETVGEVIETVGEVIEKVEEVGKDVIETVGDVIETVEDLGEGVVHTVEDVIETIEDLGEGVVHTVEDVGESLTVAAHEIGRSGEEFVRRVDDAIDSLDRELDSVAYEIETAGERLLNQIEGLAENGEEFNKLVLNAMENENQDRAIEMVLNERAHLADDSIGAMITAVVDFERDVDRELQHVVDGVEQAAVDVVEAVGDTLLDFGRAIESLWPWG